MKDERIRELELKLAQAAAPQQTSSSPAIDRRFDEIEQRPRMNQIRINDVKIEIPKGHQRIT